MEKINKPCETCDRIILVHPKRKWCDGCVRVKYMNTMDKSYERISDKENSKPILQDRHGYKKPPVAICTPPANSAVSLPTVHKPVIPTNNKSIRKIRPYHHSF